MKCVIYEKAQGSKLKYNELKLQKEVEAIVEKNQSLRKERLLRQQKAGEEKEEKEGRTGKIQGAAEQGGTGEPTQKRRFPKRRRLSQTGVFFLPEIRRPNIIYGREFDDEAIELENVVGEMGEITIREKSSALTHAGNPQ